MFHSLKCTGLWSVGLVYVATASSSTGSTALLSVIVSSIVNLICVQHVSSSRAPPLGSWLDQLGHLCWVSVASSTLSSYLDYYDDLQHHNYLHLVPIDVFPKVMPLVVIIVVSALFALGLEESYLLQTIASLLLWWTFLLFAACGVAQNENHFSNFTTEQTAIDQVAIGAAVWFPFTSSTKDVSQMVQSKDIFVSTSLYTSALIILSSLSTKRNNAGGGSITLIEPLATEYPLYRLIQVPAVSCCMSLALYQLYVPALESVARKSFVPRLSKENRLTGTKLAAVTLVGIYCSLLIYLNSPGQLVQAGASSSLLARSFDFLHILRSGRLPFSSILPKKSTKKKTSGYTAVRRGEVLSGETKAECDILSSDSGHSTDTDIDDIVQEYRMKTQVLRGVETRNPTRRSGLIVTVLLAWTVLLSLVVSWQLMNDQVHIIPWCTAAQLVMFGVIACQPIRSEMPQTMITTFRSCVSVGLMTTLFGLVAISVWKLLLAWTLLGSALYFHHELWRAATRLSNKRSANVLISPLLSTPSIEIKLQPVQLRNKLV